MWKWWWNMTLTDKHSGWYDGEMKILDAMEQWWMKFNVGKYDGWKANMLKKWWIWIHQLYLTVLKGSDQLRPNMFLPQIVPKAQWTQRPKPNPSGQIIIFTNPDLPEIFGVSFPFQKSYFLGGPKTNHQIHQAESKHHDTSGCLFFFCCPRGRTRYLWDLLGWRNAFPTFPRFSAALEVHFG